MRAINITDGLNSVPSHLSPGDIEDALKSLQAAIDNHRAWFTRFHESLLCAQPFEESVVSLDAHTRCQFGQWLYGDCSGAIMALPAIGEIETAHKVLHSEARDIAMTFRQSAKVPLSSYRRLADVQLRLMRNLYQLRDDIVSQSHGFDPLTGLINRKSINTMLARCQEQFEKKAEAYTVAMLDIDHFKSINDSHGHLVGDEVLKLVSERLASGLRDVDAIGRYGGEEFLVVLHGVDTTGAVPILERVRQALRDSPIRVNDVTVSLTVSIGCADMHTEGTVWEVVRAADAALYKAKEGGRNKVVTM